MPERAQNFRFWAPVLWNPHKANRHVYTSLPPPPDVALLMNMWQWGFHREPAFLGRCPVNPSTTSFSRVIREQIPIPASCSILSYYIYELCITWCVQKECLLNKLPEGHPLQYLVKLGSSMLQQLGMLKELFRPQRENSTAPVQNEQAREASLKQRQCFKYTNWSLIYRRLKIGNQRHWDPPVGA